MPADSSAGSVTLSRSAGYGRAAAPVRIVHLGLGNFFRAHQAWYTDRAADGDEWGIAAFTGRSAAMADTLRPQEGLYTLITKAADGDQFDVISSIAAVHAADDPAWSQYWRSPDLAVVTFTVTEAAYLRGSDGRLDASRPDVQADLDAITSGSPQAARTVPGRVVAGLLVRRAAGAGPLTLLPCDNLPQNGAALAAVVDDVANAVDTDLAAWIADTVAFGTTMVDRITPATTDEDRQAVLDATGVVDAAPVPTEPFSEWVVAGAFPAGRPDWESAGARVVDDVSPFEDRKLWLLNGSHSLMAYAGSVRGHATVAEAVADPDVRGWVEQWWDEAGSHVPLPAEEVRAYRAALLARYANPRIRHALAQIAADGSQKLPVRILPTLRAEVAAGRVPPGATRAVAAWVAHLRGHGAPVKDARASEVTALVGGAPADDVARVLEYLDPQLAANAQIREAVAAHLGELVVPERS
jgi:fructuronate reductase